MRCYTQLTQEQRYQIYALKKTGHLQSKIAEFIGVHKSTISRELGRNIGGRGYRAKQAHEKAIKRRTGKVTPRIKSSDWESVEALIRFELSPEQVSKRLYSERSIRVSHEWIYQHVYRDKHSEGDLHCYLRCRKKRRKRYGSYDRRGQLRNRVSIDERPAVVEAQTRIGDWEGDTVVGKGHRGGLITMVDRKSLYTVIEPIKNRNASKLRQKLVKRMAPYKGLIHTVTFDNGKEFAEHEKIAKKLETSIYFAHPYSSWERGVNENTNGLIRQYFPKGSDLSNVSRKEVDHVMERLNHRPRKKLGFKTPFEVFFKTTTRLTDRVALAT